MQVRAAWLIEGLRIDGPARMAPLSLSPISLDRGYVGREARGIFNAELADAGFVTAVERPIWGAQIAPYHRLVSVISDELDLDGLAEVGALTSLAANAANVLALIWGGAPEVIAGATELWDDRHGGWRTLSVSAGGGAWQSSIVRKLLRDGAVLEDDDPGELWAASGSDPLIPLWLSLFRGLSGERAWDRRVFRACSLLEAIASEVAPYRSEVVDRDGDVLLDREGRVATTEQSRGKIHWTEQRSLAALVSRTRSSRLTLLGPCGRKSAFGTTCAMRSRTRDIGHRPHCQRVARTDATRLLRHSTSQRLATALTPDGSGTRTRVAPRSRSC